VEHGDVTFAQGFGVKDARGDDPVTPRTLFHIGSTTKSLTALALLQTVDRGLVTLNDPLVEHVPAFHLTRTPDAVAGILLRHLLTHTSGVADYAELEAPADEQSDAALEGFLTGRFAEIGYVASPPGAVWAYANPNFSLVGLVAQQVTGVPYRALMRDAVLAPLGMDRTFFLPSEVVADGDYAVGRNCSGADPNCPAAEMPSVLEPDAYYNPWLNPAGGAWSSVLDIARFATFLLHGQPDVLSEESRAAMASPQAPTHEIGDYESYGFGLFRDAGIFLEQEPERTAYYPTPVLTHDGDVAGFASTLLCFPGLDICFLALANGSGAHFEKSFALALPSLVTLPAPTAPPDIGPHPDLFAAYAGSYDDPFVVGMVEVTAQDGNVFISVPSLDAQGVSYTSELAPLHLDSFAMTVQGAVRPLTFIADSSGAYTYLRSRPYLAVRSPTQQFLGPGVLLVDGFPSDDTPVSQEQAGAERRR
jgi:CubicO group peptidase (beta-lactamase class C family)